MAREPTVRLQGELQMEVMRALWRCGRASSVDEVRDDLPQRHRGAYTTVQTVLNRLAERGLLVRQRQGKAIFYAPKLSESEYYSLSVRQTLSTASEDIRRTALAQLVGEMPPGELSEIEALAREVSRRRTGGRS
ncbi:MAG: BlaI/MecI/CopY family transcriptional regulator [Actinobacteria bacterium]|nr:BlaI/MecI/CopY family transcriptional regulator [Actinomycetota bacterium]